MFFVFSPDRTFEIFETAELAKTAAESALREYRDAASCDGWCDEAEHVCWGEIKQMAKAGPEKTACEWHECEEDCDGTHDLDTYLDITLEDV